METINTANRLPRRGRRASGGWSDFINFRLSRKMSQEDAAIAIGCSQSTISDWEQLKRVPTIQDFPAIAKFLDITEAEVYSQIQQKFFQKSYL